MRNLPKWILKFGVFAISVNFHFHAQYPLTCTEAFVVDFVFFLPRTTQTSAKNEVQWPLISRCLPRRVYIDEKRGHLKCHRF